MRIRTIKPEFWSHPVMTSLPDECRLAAIGLLNVADDEGYFLAKPAAIRSELWPLDEDSTKARRVLAQLLEAGWIEVREHQTHGAIGFVVNFSKHQRVDRPSPSKIKCYFLDESSSNDRRSIDDRSLLEQGAGSREQGAGSRGGTPTTDPPAAPSLATWVRTRTSDPMKSAENSEELASLILRFGLTAVQQTAEKMAFSLHRKVWPNEITEALLGAQADASPPVPTAAQRMHAGCLDDTERAAAAWWADGGRARWQEAFAIHDWPPTTPEDADRDFAANLPALVESWQALTARASA